MIGWASAPFNPAWQRQYPRRSAWMALAGPAANFSLMILAGIAIRIGLAAGYFRAPEFIRGYANLVSPANAGDPTFLTSALSILFVLNLLLGHVQFAARASAGRQRRDHGADAGRRGPALPGLDAAFQEFRTARFDHRLVPVRSEFSSRSFPSRCKPCTPGSTTASPRGTEKS